MQYMVIIVVVAAVTSIGWLVHARTVDADKARTRKAHAAQKVRLAQLQPAEESSNRKTSKSKPRTFGNR